jgi:hypothetical protein
LKSGRRREHPYWFLCRRGGLPLRLGIFSLRTGQIVGAGTDGV